MGVIYVEFDGTFFGKLQWMAFTDPVGGFIVLLKFYIIPLPIIFFFAKSVSFIKRMLIAIRDEYNYMDRSWGSKKETFNIN